MNTFVESEISNFEKKMAGYQYLLNFRYQNLCVKADPAALLPVSINARGSNEEIEDVADVSTPDEYHFVILPKMSNIIQDINLGVLSAHPEFKVSVEEMEEGNPDTRFLVYEMPKVNEERRDFLNEVANMLHDQCKLRMDQFYAEETAGFKELFESNPEGFKEAAEAVNKVHDESLDAIREIMEKKKQEIEEGYQHWLEERPQDTGDAGSDLSITQAMKLGEVEE